MKAVVRLQLFIKQLFIGFHRFLCFRPYFIW